MTAVCWFLRLSSIVYFLGHDEFDLACNDSEKSLLPNKRLLILLNDFGARVKITASAANWRRLASTFADMKLSFSLLISLLFIALTLFLGFFSPSGDGYSLSAQDLFQAIAFVLLTSTAIFALRSYFIKALGERASAWALLLSAGSAIPGALLDAKHPEFSVGLLGTVVALYALEQLRETLSWPSTLLFNLGFFLALSSTPANAWVLTLLWVYQPWKTQSNSPLRIRETLLILPFVLLLLSLFIHIRQGSFDNFLRFDLRNPIYLLLSYREGLFLYNPLLLLASLLFLPFWNGHRREGLAYFLSGVTLLLCFMAGITSLPEGAYPAAAVAGIIPLALVLVVKATRVWGTERYSVAVPLLLLTLIFSLLPMPALWKWHHEHLNFHQVNRDSFRNLYTSLTASRFTPQQQATEDTRHRISYVLEKHSFENETDYILRNDSNAWYRMNADVEFAFSRKQPMQELRAGLSTLMHYRFRYRLVEGPCSNPPLFVVTLENPEGTRNYTTEKLVFRSDQQWQWVELTYVLPEEDFSKDILASYFWNPGQCFLEVDDLSYSKTQFTESEASSGLFPF